MIQDFEQKAFAYLNKRNEILNNYLNKVSVEIDGILSVEAIKKIGKSKFEVISLGVYSKIENAEKILLETKKDFNKTYVDTDYLIQTSNLPLGYKNDFIEEYTITKDNYIHKSNDFFSNQQDILKLYKRIMTFLLNNRGKYFTEGEQVLFESDDVLNEYNKLLKELEELSIKEQSALKALNK